MQPSSPVHPCYRTLSPEQAVSAALENAKESIYIADWWVSPELFLRRPPYFNQEWRLDQVLKRRAEAGVKIHIVIYREVEAALTCNSEHTKHALQALCPEGSLGYGNIKVMRHPDHNVFENAADMTFYWAHQYVKFVPFLYPRNSWWLRDRVHG